MRILFLCTDSYGGHGGIALFNRELIAAIASWHRTLELTVLPRIASGPEPSALPPRARYLAAAGRSNSAYLRAIVRMRRQKFDLVLCGHTNLLPVARSITRNPVLLVFGIEAWKPLRDPISRHMSTSLRGLVAISEVTRNRFLGWSHFDGPSFLLPNPIRLEDYGIRSPDSAIEASLGVQGRRVLLTVGRLAGEERYKGFDEVMDVLPSLFTRHEDLVYLIAGGGNDEPRLKKRARDLGISDRVIFTGRFEESLKRSLYDLSDVYVMPSRGEGFGFVFLEALASGLPAIGSKHDGGREALRGGELGLLVDPAIPAELEAAIDELLRNPQPRFIPGGLDHFQVANFVTRTHEILELLRSGQQD